MKRYTPLSLQIILAACVLSACMQPMIDPGPQTETSAETKTETQTAETSASVSDTDTETTTVGSSAEETTTSDTGEDTTSEEPVPETEAKGDAGDESAAAPAVDPESVKELSEVGNLWNGSEEIGYEDNVLLVEIAPDIRLYGSIADGDGDIMDRQVVRVAHDGTYDEHKVRWIGRYGDTFHNYGLVDCDGDGEDEIAVSLTEGTGTGFYVDGLTVFDLVDGHYTATSLDHDPGSVNCIEDLLAGVMDIDVHNEAQVVYINGMEIDLDPYYDMMSMDDMVLLNDDDIHYTDHIHFDKIGDGKITGWAGICLRTSAYYVDETVEFDVRCTDGRFSLEDVRMVRESRWGQ